MFEWPSVDSIKELGEYAVNESGQKFPGWFPHADSHIQNALNSAQALQASGESDLITLASHFLWNLQGTTLSQSDDPMNEVVQQAAIDGNKRSAVANVLTFLQQNGVDISGLPLEELSLVVVRASKEDEINGPLMIEQFLRPHTGLPKTSGWETTEPPESQMGIRGRLETKNTTELKQGDIVWDHGMKLLIDQPMQLSKTHPGNNTFWTRALVLNPGEVQAAGVVPWGWVMDPSHPSFDGQPRWTIQGNELATWGVEPEWNTPVLEPRGSRFGFVMLAADIGELAATMRTNLMARQDIAAMNQQWHPDYVAWQASPEYPNQPQPYQGETANPKYNPTLYRQIQQGLNYLPDELFKYFTWFVTQMKKGSINYNQLQHVRDILTQFRNHTEYLRTSPRNSPLWEQTPDINQLDFPALEGWVYSRNNKGVDPRPSVQWEAVTPSFEWKDGWYVTPVTTANDLKQEGEIMGHCVGGYCDAVNSGDTTIWSLRDSKGESHVTIEMTPKDNNFYSVVQIQGKSNMEPKEEYKARVREWFDHLLSGGWSLDSVWDIDSVYMLERWYEDAQVGSGLDDYGIDNSVSMDIESVAREIAEDAESTGDPYWDILSAYGAAIDHIGKRGEGEYALRAEAENVIETMADRLRQDAEEEYRRAQYSYEEYIRDWHAEAEQQHDEGQEDLEEEDREEYNPDYSEAPSFEDWLTEFYGEDEAYRIIGANDNYYDWDESAKNELGWSDWWNSV